MRLAARMIFGSMALAMLAGGCDSGAENGVDPVPRSRARAVEVEPASGPLVIFLGNSLTAGYGLSEEEAFPALWAAGRRDQGQPVRMVNAGISGDTTAGGLARVDWLLRQRPDVLVVELGANDGLRGLALEETRANLDQIIRRSRAAGTHVLLLGMQIPPSYGADYSGEFASLFADLAAQHEIVLMPFLLAGVAAEPQLNQVDGIHPNADGHRLLAVNIAPFLEEVLAGLS